jgi:hypothetical protein
MNDLETRIAKLEAKDAIRDLKIRYARVCDAGFKPADMRPLFTEDAVLDAGARGPGPLTGRDVISNYYGKVPEYLTWCHHYMTNGSIEVADDLEHATGTWYFYEPCTMNGRAVIVMGSYVDHYRKDDDGWKFERVEITSQAATPLDKGWVEERYLKA